MVTTVNNLLGQGIYTPSEVALYTREHPTTVARWLMGNKAAEPVIARQFRDEPRFVTFLDFVQTLAIATIRRQYKVPLQTIREALAEARNFHKVEFPFAMKHKTVLYERVEKGRVTESLESDDESHRRFELFIRLEDKDESLVQLTGRHKKQYALKDIVELYLKDISFDAAGLASSYRAWNRGNLSITMDPKRHFGEPLAPSGYTAYALAEAVKIEGSIDRAAVAYGVDRTEVELACSYLDYLRVIPRRE